MTIMSNDMTGSQGWRREDGALVGEIVGRILPEDLYGYFFFDGERIERIVQKRKEERDQLRKATRTLLGVEVLTRAEFHLAKVRKQFEGQLRKMGDPETKGLLDDKASLEENLHRCRAESDEKANNIDVFEKHIGDIEGELLRIASTAAMQERRNELSRDRKGVHEALLRCDDKLASLVSRSGYSVFMGDAVSVFRAVSADLTERGQLPSGIKLQFVEDLLEDGVCICGRSLGEDASAARNKVSAWREKAGPADIEKRLYEVGAEAMRLKRLVRPSMHRLRAFRKIGCCRGKECQRSRESWRESVFR